MPEDPNPTSRQRCDDCAGTGVDRYREDGVAEPCPVCRGTGLEESAGGGLPRSRRTPEWGLVVLGSLASLGLALVLTLSIVNARSRSDPLAPTSAVNISAFARKFITERVLTGRTDFVFPDESEEGDEAVEALGNGRFQVMSYVDSRGGAVGPMTRTRYALLMRYDPSDGWVVEGLTTVP